MINNLKNQNDAPAGVVVQLNGYTMNKIDALVTVGLFDDQNQLIQEALSRFQPIINCVLDSPRK